VCDFWNDCSGNGFCNGGECLCNNDYTMADCSKKVTNMTVCTEEAPCTLSIEGPGWFALQYRSDEDIKATISTNVTTDIYVGKGWYRVYPDSFNNDLAILGMNSTATLDSGLLLFNSKGNP